MPDTDHPKLKRRSGPAAWVRDIRRKMPRPISLAWQYQALRRWLTGGTDRTEARLIHRDRDLAIAWLPGRSTRMVLVFVSIQVKPFHPNKLQLRNFVSDGGENHVLFILDRRRCWYSRDGMRDRIAKVVNLVIAREGIQTTWSIGTSMGGYGAILFCDRLPISQVLAFVPQILMTDEVINQPQWSYYRPPIQDGVERDLTKIMAKTGPAFHLVYGDRDHDDPNHYGHLNRVLPDAEHIRMVTAPGQEHHVVDWLNRQGQLGKVIDAIWTGDRAALEECSRNLERQLELTRA